MQPTGRDFTPDIPITNALIGYRNPAYIADQIFPIVPVQRQTGIIPKLTQSPWFRDQALIRARGTKSKGGGFAVDNTDVYACERFSWREEITDEDRDLAVGTPYALELLKSRKAYEAVDLKREVAFAGDFFATGKWTNQKTGATDFVQWSDYANSQPLVDIATYRDEVEGRIGQEANVGVIGKQVWLKLRWHPNLVDSIKYTQVGMVSEQLAASLFDLSKLLIGRAIFTVTAEGVAEASVSYSRVWGKHMLLAYVTPTPMIGEPTAGLTLTWERVPGAIRYTKRMRDEEREVDIFEANSYFDQKQVLDAAGTFLLNASA
jgi:hypothetical protein